MFLTETYKCMFTNIILKYFKVNKININNLTFQCLDLTTLKKDFLHSIYVCKFMNKMNMITNEKNLHQRPYQI